MVKQSNPSVSFVAEHAAVAHRAIWHLRLPLSRVVGGTLLAAFLSGCLLWLRPWVSRIWSDVLLWWLNALELPGRFSAPDAQWDSLVALPVPLIDARLSAPDAGAIFGHLAAVLLMWVVSGWLSDAVKPLTFVVRLVALIHGASVMFFLFWPASFAHSLGEHVESGMKQIWYLALLVPWVHLATYYLFPVGYRHRAALSVLTMLYLLVLGPNLYALHVALVMYLGWVVMPVLSLLLGVLLAVVGFVSLYGWGMSWGAVDQGAP